MNAVAVASGVGDAVSGVELADGLRDLVAEGLARQGEVVVFAGYSGWAGEPPGSFGDLTGWECSVNSFHLEDLLPVPIDQGISGEDQVLLLRHGMRFALEVARLGRELPEPVALCCIVSANETGATFRFHRVRAGESWLSAALDGYALEKIVVVDSRR